MNSETQKTVLITGGTRGIGKALVSLYQSRGWHVIATGRQPRHLDTARMAQPDVQWHRCDLADNASIDQFVSEVIHQDLDLVIHNAGVQQERDLFQSQSESISEHDETQINLTAPILLTRKLFDNVLRAKGTWVFITSGLAIAPKQSSPVYCANKAGLRTFCKSFRSQARVQKQPVRVCEAIMTLVDTEMTQGRGKGKISPEQAALEVVQGIDKQKEEIRVGATRWLMLLRSIAPNWTENLLIKL